MPSVAELAEAEAELFPGRRLIEIREKNFNYWADAESAVALQHLQVKATAQGFKLQVCSAYRSVERQYQIFKDKFTGKRQVLDATEQPVDISRLSASEKIKAITYFSALPGLSRHHMGTDFDVYAANLLPEGQMLQLTCREYAPDAYFYSLGQFLQVQAPSCGFVQPFCMATWHGGREPWHLSYSQRARQLLSGFSFEALLKLYALFDDDFMPALIGFAKQHYRNLLCMN